jgi:hypothetical protein
MRKSCKFRGSEIAKKRVCFAYFRKIAKAHFQAKMVYETKRKEAKKTKEVKGKEI